MSSETSKDNRACIDQLEDGRRRIEQLLEMGNGVFMRLRFREMDAVQQNPDKRMGIYEQIAERVKLISRNTDVVLKVSEQELAMFYITDEAEKLVSKKCQNIVEWVTHDVVWQDSRLNLHCALGYAFAHAGEAYDALYQQAEPHESWQSGEDRVPEFIRENAQIHKKNILIVDDLDVNRIVLGRILKEFYNVAETDSGMAAIAELQQNGYKYSLVLLDNYMPGMNGMEVLQVMGQKNWLSTLPVVMISSDSNDELVNQAYQLGASDFLFKPFTPAIVLRRVQHIIELNQKHNYDINNTLSVLSDAYHMILQADLTANTCKVIHMLNQEDMWQHGIDTNAAEAVRYFTEKGFIHQDDKQAFIQFLSAEHLKKLFAEGKQHLEFHYRGLVGEEYRWMLLEVTRANSYAPEMVVIISSKDVQESYLAQRREFAHLSSQALYTDYCNLSKNEFYRNEAAMFFRPLMKDFIYVTDGIAWAAEKIADEKIRAQYIEVFQPKNLLAAYQNENSIVTLEHTMQLQQEERQLYRTTVRMLRDKRSKDIEAVFSIENCTNQFIQKKIEKLLYDKEYDFIGLLDVKNETYTIHKSNFMDKKIATKQSMPYETVLQYELNDLMQPQDRAAYVRKVDLHYIAEQVKERGIYEFTISRRNCQGSTMVLRQVYRMFDEQYEIILCLISDITELENEDSITGKLNRRGLAEKAKQQFQKCPERAYAVLHFDIKEFKAINGVFGYEQGNLILRNVAKKLQKSPLEPILLARVMADQFVCLADRTKVNLSQMPEICQDKMELMGKTVHISMQCGIYYPEDLNEPIAKMCDKAKLAEEDITNEFMMPYAVYKYGTHKDYIRRKNVMNNVYEAMDNDEFQVYYQPVYDAFTEQIVSAEALVRWIHPTEGIISPGVFISALEEKGTISRLDQYVAEQVQNFLQNRKQEGKAIVPVSMNLSRMDFFNQEMLADLIKMVSHTTLEKDYLRYEVTESAFVDIRGESASVLEQLRALGSSVLIDDFGSGYSSLGCLTQYEFDIVKLDMSMVRNIGKSKKAEAVLCAVVDMVHQMQAKVVAEGVETIEQLTFLRECGCDYIQGYYFSKPVPQKEFINMLENAAVK